MHPRSNIFKMKAQETLLACVQRGLGLYPPLGFSEAHLPPPLANHLHWNQTKLVSWLTLLVCSGFEFILFTTILWKKKEIRCSTFEIGALYITGWFFIWFSRCCQWKIRIRRLCFIWPKKIKMFIPYKQYIYYNHFLNSEFWNFL